MVELPTAIVRKLDAEEMRLASLNEAELRREIRAAFSDAGKKVLQMAKALHVLILRGFDDSEFRQLFGPMYDTYLRLGSGEWDSDLFMAYGATPMWRNAICRLPVAEQRRLALRGGIEMPEFGPEGQQDCRLVPLAEIANDSAKIAQVFNTTKGRALVRTVAQQVIYLTEDRRQVPPPVAEIADGWEIDRRKCSVRWVKTSTPPAEIPLKVLRALLGKLEK